MGFFLLSACATYQDKVQESRQQITNGQLELAADQLEKLATEPGNDQLVYLMDYGSVLQMKGSFSESNRIFLAADKLSEELDYHSVTKITGSVLLNEEMKQYKGDTFEKVFINAYLAMNYLQLGKLDDALVEARRINEKFLKFKSDEKKEFELNAFGKYLSAVIWEANHDYDDAFLAYKEAYSIDQRISNIDKDLIRLAKLSKRFDELRRLKLEFPEVQEDPRDYDKKSGEIIIVVLQGWGPRKAMSFADKTFPELRRVYSSTQSADVELNGKSEGMTSLIYDVQEASIKALQDDYAALVARRVGSAIVKDITAEEIRKRNGELAGFIAWVVMHAADRADLRQWSLLPQTVQMKRLRVSPGKYHLKLYGLDSSYQRSGEFAEFSDIQVPTGKTKFIFWRTVK